MKIKRFKMSDLCRINRLGVPRPGVPRPGLPILEDPSHGCPDWRYLDQGNQRYPDQGEQGYQHQGYPVL